MQKLWGAAEGRREGRKKEKVQLWLVERWISSLVEDRFSCVAFLQQINDLSSENYRAELGETTWSAGHLGFERVSPGKCGELCWAAGGFPE